MNWRHTQVLMHEVKVLTGTPFASCDCVTITIYIVCGSHTLFGRLVCWCMLVGMCDVDLLLHLHLRRSTFYTCICCVCDVRKSNFLKFSQCNWVPNFSFSETKLVHWCAQTCEATKDPNCIRVLETIFDLTSSTSLLRHTHTHSFTHYLPPSILLAQKEKKRNFDICSWRNGEMASIGRRK